MTGVAHGCTFGMLDAGRPSATPRGPRRKSGDKRRYFPHGAQARPHCLERNALAKQMDGIRVAQAVGPMKRDLGPLRRDQVWRSEPRCASTRPREPDVGRKDLAIGHVGAAAAAGYSVRLSPAGIGQREPLASRCLTLGRPAVAWRATRWPPASVRQPHWFGGRRSR